MSKYSREQYVTQEYFLKSKLIELAVNGRGRIVADFPIYNAKVSGAFVRAEGTIAPPNALEIIKMEGTSKIKHFRSCIRLLVSPYWKQPHQFVKERSNGSHH